MSDPIQAPIQVWENHSGPIAPSGQLLYRYVSYIDAEADAGIYGYGDTPSEAAADYIRNMAEALCNSCTEDECPNANDCILIEPNFSAFIRQHLPVHLQPDLQPDLQPEDDTSHREWRSMNPLPRFGKGAS